MTFNIDVIEQNILEYNRNLLNILLKDHSTGENIRWATTDYEDLGELYHADQEITALLIMTIGLPKNFVDSSKYKANRAAIKKWLIRTLLKKVFSGQPDTVLRPIRDIIRNNGNDIFPFEEIVERFRGTNKPISFTNDDIEDYLLTLRYGKPDTLSTLMLLYPSLDFRHNFHIDHIFPKSKFNKKYLQEKGVPVDEVDDCIYEANNICNLQLLASIPNEEKSDTDFEEWFDEENPTSNDKKQYRDLHMIPEMNYGYKDFLDFVDRRAQIMAEELKKILI